MTKKDLTPNIRKGFDLTIKSLKRKYNFVLGWEVIDNFEDYDSVSFIDIVVDYDKVSDYFGTPIRAFAKERLKLRDPGYIGNIIYSLDGYLSSPNGWDVPYNTKKDMEKWCEFFYKQLPPEYLRHYLYRSPFDGGERVLPATFKLMNFIIDYRPST